MNFEQQARRFMAAYFPDSDLHKAVLSGAKVDISEEHGVPALAWQIKTGRDYSEAESIAAECRPDRDPSESVHILAENLFAMFIFRAASVASQKQTWSEKIFWSYAADVVEDFSISKE